MSLPPSSSLVTLWPARATTGGPAMNMCEMPSTITA
jgi:hypothetical protein